MQTQRNPISSEQSHALYLLNDGSEERILASEIPLSPDDGVLSDVITVDEFKEAVSQHVNGSSRLHPAYTSL